MFEAANRPLMDIAAATAGAQNLRSVTRNFSSVHSDDHSKRSSANSGYYSMMWVTI